MTYTVQHGLLRGLRRRGGLGFLPQRLTGGGETAEHRFWAALPLTGLAVYDIGAYHGLMTMFFARQAQQVIAFEPNSRNRARLTENLALNGIKNVLVRPIGIGATAGEAVMDFDPLLAGGATVRQAGALDRHMDASRRQTETIMVTTLDEDVRSQRLPAPDLIKIDIEGLELSALQGATATLDSAHPALFLEMHGETRNEKRSKVRAIVAFLEGRRYPNILHVESGTRITSANSDIAAQGHLYCRRDGA